MRPYWKGYLNLPWSPVRLSWMRRARPLSASRCGRSTRPPAIACASKEPRRAREQSRRANGRKYHAAVCRNAATGSQP
jgi:hypothetical protein